MNADGTGKVGSHRYPPTSEPSYGAIAGVRDTESLGMVVFPGNLNVSLYPKENACGNEKQYFLLLLIPFLLSFQCEEDLIAGFETRYLIQNDLTEDLFLLNERNSFLVIPAGGEMTIGTNLNPEAHPVHLHISVLVVVVTKSR